MKLYKYRNFENLYMEKIIENSSLYFSHIADFNDPFDCRLSYRQNYSKQEISQYFIDLKMRNPNQPYRLKDIKNKYGKKQDFITLQNDTTKKTVEKMGVLSLSSNFENILMWSHYSKSHTGLVFEFTPKDVNDENSCFYHPDSVDYLESYVELSYANDHREEIPKLLFVKYKDWKYEEEYRIFDLDFQGEKKFHKNELTAIIFGVNAKIENIQKIIDLCQMHGFDHMVFKKAKIEHGKFALSFEIISLGGVM